MQGFSNGVLLQFSRGFSAIEGEWALMGFQQLLELGASSGYPCVDGWRTDVLWLPKTHRLRAWEGTSMPVPCK